MKIQVDDLSSPQIACLLSEHMQEMREHSPEESIHALDIDALRQATITFWSVWQDNELLGCCALKELESQHAEIKSMRVAYQHQGKGIANCMMEHILKIAEQRNYRRLSLETGSMAGFHRARQLYQKYGFGYCGPFADYVADPNSVFMNKIL